MSVQPNTRNERLDEDFFDRIDKLIEFNKKELETNPVDKKLIATEKEYERVWLELKKLEHHQSVLSGGTKVLDLDSTIQSKENELKQLQSKSIIRFKECSLNLERDDIVLPRCTTDNVECARRTIPLFKLFGGSKIFWNKYNILYSTSDDDKYVPKTNNLYIEKEPSYPQVKHMESKLDFMKDTDFTKLIKDLPMAFKFMGGHIYNNWYHRLKTMYTGLYHIAKHRDNFSTIIRTPQYLRVCYALGIITEEQWRDLTVQEEQTRFYAIEAVPILQNWIADFEEFLNDVKMHKSTDDLFDRVKQMDNDSWKYIHEMERLHAKYSDPTIYNIYTSTFKYAYINPFESGCA